MDNSRFNSCKNNNTNKSFEEEKEVKVDSKVIVRIVKMKKNNR